MDLCRGNGLCHLPLFFSHPDMQLLDKYKKQLYIACLALLAVSAVLAVLPPLSGYFSWLTPPLALFLGLLYALLCGQPFPDFNKRMSKKLLQYAIVGLGFGMNLYASLSSGKEGMLFTIVSVAGTMIVGCLLGVYLCRLDKETSYLLSSGTAICGGSAIAAVGQVIRAKDSSMSVALGTIFILNAIALFVFPPIGRWLGLSQQDFGLWAAIAIHDTSSVVGAGAAYGEEALQVATMVKLTRALWIIPLALVTSFVFPQSGKKVTIPWFIVFFVLAMLVNTFVLPHLPGGLALGSFVNVLARKALTIALFFIGASLSLNVLRQVGFKPIMLGVLLWILISVLSLIYIQWDEWFMLT